MRRTKSAAGCAVRLPLRTPSHRSAVKASSRCDRMAIGSARMPRPALAGAARLVEATPGQADGQAALQPHESGPQTRQVILHARVQHIPRTGRHVFQDNAPARAVGSRGDLHRLEAGKELHHVRERIRARQPAGQQIGQVAPGQVGIEAAQQAFNEGALAPRHESGRQGTFGDLRDGIDGMGDVARHAALRHGHAPPENARLGERGQELGRIVGAGIQGFGMLREPRHERRWQHLDRCGPRRGTSSDSCVVGRRPQSVAGRRGARQSPTPPSL